MKNALAPLGGTEMEILRHVWAVGRATVRDVHDRVKADRPLAYTTVMTVMKNLAAKGYLKYDIEGTAYVYSAAQRPEDVRGSVLTGILDKVFGGSTIGLVQTLVRHEDLSTDDISELRALIETLSPNDHE